MASKRAIRRKKCGNKVRYADRDSAAKTQINLLLKKGRTEAIATYHCRFCAGWHVGHTPYRYTVAGKSRAVA